MLRLELADAALAAAAAEHGFEFHHAEGQNACSCWLPPTRTRCRWATHQVGGCGFVLNDKGELLVIKEWRFDDNGVRQPSAQWKMPGGMLNKGESFADGICREVLEETGVQTRFVSLLTFWHRHGVSTNFAAAEGGKSDMYFCARLEPVTDEIRLQEDEISACEWQDLRAFCRENDHPSDHGGRPAACTASVATTTRARRRFGRRVSSPRPTRCGGSAGRQRSRRIFPF